MSNVPPLNEATLKTIQNLTRTSALLIEQSDVMRVNICHYLMDRQTQELQHLNNTLLKLLNTKK